MRKKQSEAKPHLPLTEAHRKKRGRALDELQQRIADLKSQDLSVPAEWQERVQELSETDDSDVVDEHADWLAEELPPKEYFVAEITWQTFQHFSNALLNALTVFAIRSQILSTGYDEAAANIMREIVAIKDATYSPVIAMSELAKARSRAVKSLTGFEESL